MYLTHLRPSCTTTAARRSRISGQRQVDDTMTWHQPTTVADDYNDERQRRRRGMFLYCWFPFLLLTYLISFLEFYSTPYLQRRSTTRAKVFLLLLTIYLISFFRILHHATCCLHGDNGSLFYLVYNGI